MKKRVKKVRSVRILPRYDAIDWETTQFLYGEIIQVPRSLADLFEESIKYAAYVHGFPNVKFKRIRYNKYDRFKLNQKDIITL